MAWGVCVVDCGAGLVDVVPWFWVVELVPEFVVVLVDEDDEDEDEDADVDVELWVDPGRFTARASAPATPETPTAEVTRFIRARSRLRALFGCSDSADFSDNARCTAALRPLGSLDSLTTGNYQRRR